jgi:hypothetical protein
MRLICMGRHEVRRCSELAGSSRPGENIVQISGQRRVLELPSRESSSTLASAIIGTSSGLASDPERPSVATLHASLTFSPRAKARRHPLYNEPVTCPLCRQRKPRRLCPATGEQICTICCGTKRLVEIHCPPNCVYLTTAREHPPASVARQQSRDLQTIVKIARDLNESQSRLLFFLDSFLAGYKDGELDELIDEDVIEAAGAVAATLETAARGVIYEHRPASLPAQRLAAAFRKVLVKAGGAGGSAFERDASVVMRRIEDGSRQARASEPGNKRAFLELLNRVARQGPDEPPADPLPRLIVP